jgi:hypothetical protein
MFFAFYLALAVMGTFTLTIRQTIEDGEPGNSGPAGVFTAIEISIDYLTESQTLVSRAGKYPPSFQYNGFPRAIALPGTSSSGAVLFQLSAGICGNIRRPGIKSAIPLNLRI